MTSFSQQFVLTIVNIKAAAREIYSEAPCVLLDAGYAPTVIDTTMSDVQIRDRARKYAVRNPQRTHERCLLCPVHCRRSWVKIWLEARQRALCASTALIEAELPGHCAQSGRAAEHRACPRPRQHPGGPGERGRQGERAEWGGGDPGHTGDDPGLPDQDAGDFRARLDRAGCGTCSGLT